MSQKIEKCPICDYPNPYNNQNPVNDTYRVNCPRCKTYIITEMVLRFPDTMERLHKVAPRLSGLSRYLAETGGEPIIIKTENIEELAENSLIPDDGDINKKSQKLLEAIRRRTTSFGQKVDLSWNTDYPLAFAANHNELHALLDFLAENGTIKIILNAPAVARLSITAQGWNNLKISAVSEARQVFIAVWFDEKGTMDNAIKSTKEAIRETGYVPVCIKDEHYPETIMDKALSEIRQSRFLIVNLTQSRPSVLFEAGFAFGLGIDIVYVCDESFKTSTEFYSKHYKIYFYKNYADLKDQLIQVIKARGL